MEKTLDSQVQRPGKGTNHIFQLWGSTKIFNANTRQTVSEEQCVLFERLLYLVLVGRGNQKQMDRYVRCGPIIEHACLGFSDNGLGRGAFRAKRGRPRARKF